MSRAYSSEECEIFAQALAQALGHLSEIGQNCEEPLTRAAISHGILRAAELGERSVEVLAAYALAHIEDSRHELRTRANGDGKTSRRDLA